MVVYACYMKPLKTETLFQISMWWRIIYGFIRVLLGLAMLRLINTDISDVLYTLFQHELFEDRMDTLYLILSQFLTDHSYTITYFLAGYFLFWGFTDVFLSYAMLRHILWAFNVGFVLIALFICYEMYRYTHTHSVILLGVIVVDIVIIWIMYREYRQLHAKTMRVM